MIQNDTITISKGKLTGNLPDCQFNLAQKNKKNCKCFKWKWNKKNWNAKM